MKTKTSTLRQMKRHWILYLMVLPALASLFFFSYKPMYGLIIAFKDFNFRQGYFGSPWVGLKHFKRLVTSYWFPTIIKNTLTISLLSVLIEFPFPIIFALFFNELRKSRIKSTIQTITYAPHFISTVVVCGMVISFLNPSTGIINKAIEFFGGQPIAFMQETRAFKWIFVLSGAWVNAGWSTIIYTAALSSVDVALLEAAKVDGANRWQRMWHINLPTLLPTVVIQLILVSGTLLNVGYEKTLLLQNTMNIGVSEVISTYVYRMGLINHDYSFSTAAGLLNSVVNVIVLTIVNQISKKVSETSLL